MTTSTAGLRRTAATKYSEDILEIHQLHNEIMTAGDAVEQSLATQTDAREILRNTQATIADIKQEVTNRVTEKLVSVNEKVAQAVIDREIKSSLSEHDIFCEKLQYELQYKADVDNAEATVVTERYKHRSLIARSNLLAAHLNYLAASKSAAAVAASTGLVGI